MSEYLRQIDIIVSSDLDPEAAALDFAGRVRADIEREIAAGRGRRQFTRYVDGREGLPETAVRPGGTILYEFGQIAEIMVFALSFLRARSPQGVGMGRGGRRYRDNFYAGVDGKFYAPGQFDPADLPTDGREYVIGNAAPYSRKLDVQMIGGRALRFSVPPNLFADAAREVNRRFGNQASARRYYSWDFPGRYVLKNNQMHGNGRRVKRHAGEPVESPALVIIPRD